MARERGAPRARDLHLGTGLDPTCPLSGAEKLASFGTASGHGMHMA